MKGSIPPTRGVMVSGKALVGIVIVIGLLLVLTLVASSSSFNSAPTATTTVTVTQAFTKVLNEGGNSSLGLASDYEAIYARANPSIVTLAGTRIETSGFGSAATLILGSGFIVNYSGSLLCRYQLSRRRHHVQSYSHFLGR